jgi:hypothetical protein
MKEWDHILQRRPSGLFSVYINPLCLLSKSYVITSVGEFIKISGLCTVCTQMCQYINITNTRHILISE